MKQTNRYWRKTAKAVPTPKWTDTDALELLERAPRYVGSAEHKTFVAVDGGYTELDGAALRSDASCCPPDISRDDAQQMMDESLRVGAVSRDLSTGFPRYFWACSPSGDRYFRGRLINETQGWYKAHPIERSELPELAQRRLATLRGHDAD